ncbi:hypothetical protein [Marinoscillum sp. MHG1-6]|uniref:hypothetical protein n=1 Tax=Marinoscillum sp. MHG1-6 TaxID=2959627 RepID=UPI0021581036|nr:hypothetical protein [Marinoscillum sp. MHG1-6]
MMYIWYNPDSKYYQVGSQMEYDIAVSNCKSPDDMMILYELDQMTSRLAQKIVSELNAARTELRSA